MIQNTTLHISWLRAMKVSSRSERCILFILYSFLLTGMNVFFPCDFPLGQSPRLDTFHRTTIGDLGEIASPCELSCNQARTQTQIKDRIEAGKESKILDIQKFQPCGNSVLVSRRSWRKSLTDNNRRLSRIRVHEGNIELSTG